MYLVQLICVQYINSYVAEWIYKYVIHDKYIPSYPILFQTTMPIEIESRAWYNDHCGASKCP